MGHWRLRTFFYKNKGIVLWLSMSFLSWSKLSRKILTSPFKCSSPKDLPNRSHCLGLEVDFCLRWGLNGRVLANADLPLGVRPGAGFLGTQVLFSSPSEAGSGMGKSRVLFNARFYSVSFENSLLPTLTPTQYPKILMPEKESNFF